MAEIERIGTWQASRMRSKGEALITALALVARDLVGHREDKNLRLVNNSFYSRCML